MEINEKNIGIAFTGSFCTYKKSFAELENLVAAGARVQTIFSNAAQNIDSRFGEADSFIKRAEEITGKKPFLTIKESEVVGPSAMFDLMVIMPCTGNTVAKLANGITDSPVLMAAKAHLRNGKPLVLALATNDGLAGSAPNLGTMLGRKNVYFVPFGQDDCMGKPTSLVADFTLVPETVEAACRGEQLQPVLLRMG